MTKATRPAPAPEEFVRLRQAVERVADELHALWEVTDRLRDDISWAITNDRFRCAREEFVPVAPLTSMPKDPRAPDWSERLNRFTADDLPQELQAPASPSPESPSPPAPAATSSERPARRRKQPLANRLYSRPHLIAVVRLIGYRELPLPEMQASLQSLTATFGSDKIDEAHELVFIDSTKQPPTVRLRDEVKKIAVQLLGAPPDARDQAS